ncbi:MAG TPA: aspartate-semialdehyde dehydrogenase [Candidatus Bathyarchaeia archaeon]|nr:aspartate-semialdehyde dehydrogenase [Candidatus Bathyarchaeia archaeon]
MRKAAVLGATGLVGQRFIECLNNHPWFKVTKVAASERSYGKTYGEAANWKLQSGMPSDVADLEVLPIDAAKMGDVGVVFSALPADIAGKVEEDFARAGHVVVSNASSHRMDPDVPILNPEANHDHVALLDIQRRNRKWDGAIVTNPNCCTAILTLSLKPILQSFGVKRVVVTTMQALSGAGYPGVPSLDIVDNVIPFIEHEEEKLSRETLKILGSPAKTADFQLTASCNRVQTIDGHLEAVFVETEKKTDARSVIKALENFVGEPQRLSLPTAPRLPIVVRRERDRPQPRLDRMEGNGMAVVVGRVRDDNVMNGIKYMVLGHNTIRGAAGVGVLNAELLKAKNYI